MGDSDNTVFDRLVDGELSPGERQQLLASLDVREDGWRRCALAFMEAQAWGRQLKRLTTPGGDERVIAVSQVAVSEPDSQAARRPVLGWLAVAAGLLLAFTAGQSIRMLDGSNPSSRLSAGIDRQEKPAGGELPGEALPDNDAVTLVVRDASGNPRRVQVPLLDRNAVKERFGHEPPGGEMVGHGLPAALRERFHDRGFDLERRRRYAPMYFERNKHLVPMVVPVDDTYIVPVSRPVY